MKWLSVLKEAPALKSAVDALVGPGGSCSKTVWYNLIKASVAIAGACGLGIVLTEEEVATISWALALAVPAVATVVDACASIWLRTRTHGSLADKVNTCTGDCKEGEK